MSYKVSDGQVFSTNANTISIIVNSVNDKPVFTSTPVTTATQDIKYTYKVKGTDLETAAPVISGSIVPSWLSFGTVGDVTISTVYSNTSIYDPKDIAVDDVNGYLYIVDNSRHNIVRMNKDGSNKIVFVGSTSGTYGYLDGLGTAARFRSPTAIAADDAGNLYVADGVNYRIRKITPSGLVTTIAGNGLNQTLNASNPLEASFQCISGMAYDKKLGRLYFATADRIRMMDLITGVVTTFAGDGNRAFNDGLGIAASFYGPEDVVVDPDGNVYVADKYNYRIRKISSSGLVSTYAGNGIQGVVNSANSLNASFYRIGSISIDSWGAIYVSDPDKHIVRKIAKTGEVTTVAGSGVYGQLDGVSTQATFKFLQGSTQDLDGNLYVCDKATDAPWVNRIRKIGALPIVLTGTPNNSHSNQKFPVKLAITDGTDTNSNE